MEKPDLTVAVVPAPARPGLYIAEQNGGTSTAAGPHVKRRRSPAAATCSPASSTVSIDVDEGQWTLNIDAQGAGIKLHDVAVRWAGPRRTAGHPPLAGYPQPPASRGKTIVVNVLRPDRAADRHRARGERDEPIPGGITSRAVPGDGRRAAAHRGGR